MALGNASVIGACGGPEPTVEYKDGNQHENRTSIAGAVGLCGLRAILPRAMRTAITGPRRYYGAPERYKPRYYHAPILGDDRRRHDEMSRRPLSERTTTGTATKPEMVG